MTEPTVISSCEFGCTRICKARLEGCASDCPALPWQPPIPPRDATDAKPVDVGMRWTIELRAGVRILQWDNDRGCRPATEPECEAYDALLALQAEVARLTQENARLAGAVGEVARQARQDV